MERGRGDVWVRSLREGGSDEGVRSLREGLGDLWVGPWRELELSRGDVVDRGRV